MVSFNEIHMDCLRHYQINSPQPQLGNAGNDEKVKFSVDHIDQTVN